VPTNEALDRISSPPPETVLAVSDLHLGVGQDPATGVFSPLENFFADEAFARFLARHPPRRAGGSLLVLNGDSFDFDRIPQIPRTDGDFARWAALLARLGAPRTPEALRASIVGVERSFGLRTDDYKSAWKMQRVIEGHPAFFAALATWVAQGGSLVVVKGNHDAEAYWPLVHEVLRGALRERGAPAADVAARVAFVDDSFTLGNLYVEHGHQREEMTSIVGGPLLPWDPTQLNLPLGSFVARYFVNGLERMDPFLDNVKPTQQAVLAILRRRPLTFVRLYVNARRFVGRALRSRSLRNKAVALVTAATLLLPIVTLALLAFFLFFPEKAAALTSWLPGMGDGRVRVTGVLAGLFSPFLLPYLASAVSELADEARVLFRRGPAPHPLEDVLEKVLAERLPVAMGHRRVYAVLGHTHEQGVHRLGPGGAAREEFYVNTGTWAPLWPRGRPDLMGRSLYTFLRFDQDLGGEYRHRALEWDDAAGEGRTARLLDLGA